VPYLTRSLMLIYHACFFLLLQNIITRRGIHQTTVTGGINSSINVENQCKDFPSIA